MPLHRAIVSQRAFASLTDTDAGGTTSPPEPMKPARHSYVSANGTCGSHEDGGSVFLMLAVTGRDVHVMMLVVKVSGGGGRCGLW
eukprot:1959067-Pleurochrysis_carterae.AAC.1